MAVALTPDVLQDELAVSLARVVAAANARAREAGVDLRQSLITITKKILESGLIWRVNYGAKDYVGRRGGDFIVEVDPASAQVRRVLRGQ